MEVAGEDATNMFEDIGHSSDAREEMKKFEIGHLKVCTGSEWAWLQRGEGGWRRGGNGRCCSGGEIYSRRCTVHHSCLFIRLEG